MASLISVESSSTLSSGGAKRVVVLVLSGEARRRLRDTSASIVLRSSNSQVTATSARSHDQCVDSKRVLKPLQ